MFPEYWLRGVPFRDDAYTEEQWRRHLTWKRYIPGAAATARSVPGSCACRRAPAAHLPPTRLPTHQTLPLHLHPPEPKMLAVVVVSLAPVWGWSVFAALCVASYVTWAEPAGAPRISGKAAAYDLIFTLTSFALSLLLLFKTNSRCACAQR